MLGYFSTQAEAQRAQQGAEAPARPGRLAAPLAAPPAASGAPPGEPGQGHLPGGLPAEAAAVQQPHLAEEDAVDEGHGGELVQLQLHAELELLLLHQHGEGRGTRSPRRPPPRALSAPRQLRVAPPAPLRAHAPAGRDGTGLGSAPRPPQPLAAAYMAAGASLRPTRPAPAAPGAASPWPRAGARPGWGPSPTASGARGLGSAFRVPLLSFSPCRRLLPAQLVVIAVFRLHFDARNSC